MAKNVPTLNLSEPLRETITAKFDIDTGSGNLTIDRLASSDELLASGILEYPEKQDPPSWIVDARNGQSSLTLMAQGNRQPRFRLPWATCNGETDWQIYINPIVSSEIKAHTGGGNLILNLTSMAITRLSADSGGGNLKMILPDGASNMSAAANTGGGNITVELGKDPKGFNVINATSGAGKVLVRLPDRRAALIHATTGMGKVIVDSHFNQVDKHTYKSPDYDSAIDRVEINAESGAGNVSIIVG